MGENFHSDSHANGFLVSRRILIADANADAAESLALLLHLKGHRVVTAHSGPDALAMAAAIHPEAAFLALHLPHLGGLDVCRALALGSHGPRPPLVIALTGDGRESAREASRAAGFDHHLLKPADPVEILKLLQSLSQRSEERNAKNASPTFAIRQSCVSS